VIPPRRREERGPASSLGAGLLLLLALSSGGCDGPPDPGPDPEVEGAEALGLAEGARLHRVILGGRGSEEHVLPARIQASRGDGVEFVTVDHRVHTVWFPSDSLSPQAMAFLTSTEQLESPPLLQRGSRFVLVLEDAPPGRYPFITQGHGGRASGVIEVGVSVDSLARGPS
jgi:plastocyanin